MIPRISRRLACPARALLIAASLALLAGAAHAQILYPRLGLPGCIHGDGIPYLDSLGAYDTVTLDAVARYDEVILDTSPISEYRTDILAQLRSRHPGIQMLAYVTGENIWDVNSADSLVHFPTRYNHLVRDLNGFLYDTHGARWDPMCVNIAKRDANGRYVVAEAVAALFNDVIIRTGQWDGMFVDVYGDNVSWTQFAGHTIDFARAGYPNAAALDVAWRAGSDTLAARLRAYAGANFILVGNTGIGSKYAWFNGWTREDFPFQEGGTWFTNMFWNPGGYVCDEANFRQPPHNTIYSPIEDKQPYSTTNTRRVRFGLGTAALGTGFATTGPSDRGLLNPPHDQWWFDEYAVDLASGQARTDLAHTHWLGQALGPYYQMIWAGTNPDACSNPGFETSVSSGWSFGVFSPAVATIARDTTTAGAGSASAHITITASGTTPWSVNLTSLGTLQLYPSVRYSVTFWARASSARTLPVVATLLAGGQLASQSVTLGTTWQQYQVVLQPSQAGIVVLEFFLGQGQAGEVWFDDVHMQAGETSMYRRDFENGIVLVNPAVNTLNVPLGASFRKILGIRDPLVNNGATITTATVGPSDALFLIGAPRDTVPPNPVRDARVEP